MSRSTKKFLNLTLTAIGIAMVAVALAAVESRRASATNTSTSSVLVVNLPNQPVPVAAMGTTTVAGTVSVSNLPPVTLAQGSTTEVYNTATAPLFVHDSDNPALQPAGFYLELTPANGFAANAVTVPSGKMLVVEDVDVSAHFSTSTFAFAVCGTAVGKPRLDIGLTEVHPGSTLESSWVGGSLRRLYVAGGVTLWCELNGENIDNPVNFATVSISGYYVNTP